jgi:hypothetical protein
MTESQDEPDTTPDPQPVVPATIDVSPSSTGVVVGDGSEAVPAQPPPDAPEEPAR